MRSATSTQTIGLRGSHRQTRSQPLDAIGWKTEERRIQVHLEAALERRAVAALEADLVKVDERDALEHARRGYL